MSIDTTFETIAYEILIEAATPIAHHAEVFGNSAVLARRKCRRPDGSWANVPAISGDAMRHGLREAAAYAFLDAAGLLHDGSLSEAALRLLFAGGMVTGRGDGASVKLDAYREMVDLVPPLALLGGCASNRVIPGRIICEDALLICDESAHLVPPWMLEEHGAISGARAHIEQHQRVRMDPALDPAKTRLLTDASRAVLGERLITSEAAHVADDVLAREETKSSMMPRTFEAIVAGSRLSWRVQARCTSALDVDTFRAMIGGFLANARVGGKQGTGFGAIRAVRANKLDIARPAATMQSVAIATMAPSVGELFRAHVRERAEKARTFLAGVDA